MQNENSRTVRPGGEGSAAAGQAKELARTGTEQAKEIGKTAKERALREIDSRRESFASEIEKLAGTLETQGGGKQAMGPVMEYAASAARRFSTVLKNNSAEQLLQTAARNPVAILGGTFALGFFVTRLFKA